MTVQNDTYGELTRGELASLRARAECCTTCGMLATVDPVFHAQRYGHVPRIGRGVNRQVWHAGAWIPDNS